MRQVQTAVALSPQDGPMDLQQQIALYAWCAQPLLQSAVAMVLWRRGLHKQFPVFFKYLLAQIAIFAVTYPLYRTNYARFFYAYWIAAAVSALLSFKVIHEVFLDVFRPYDTLKDLGTVLFKWAAVVMLLVSVVVAFSSATAGDPAGNWEKFLVQAVTSLQRSVRLVQCGLILFLLLFSSFLGVSRKQHSFGIALGFGFFAFVELILIALHSGGYLSASMIAVVNPGLYDLAIGIWLVYALARKATRVAPNYLQTQRWEQSLADLHNGEGSLPPDSLIPMFEGMVERAFSRGSNVRDIQVERPVSNQSEPPNAKAAKKGG